MIMKRLTIAILIRILASLLFGSGAFAQGPLSGPSASEIDGKVTASLNELYSQNDAARALLRKQRQYSSFPTYEKEPL